MSLTNNEKQKAYRKRMREDGYKLMQIWVPKESENKTVKIERKMFMKRVELLTIGWSKTKLSRLFKDVLNYISEKISKGDV